MASVKSLGLHQPSGLQYAIDEDLLPANPPPTSYKWQISTDSENDQSFEDELLTVGHNVIWCRSGVFQKTFSFELEKEPITQALLAYFPVSDHEKAQKVQKAQKNGVDTNLNDRTTLSKALVVFLKTQAHIYFLAGTSHVIHIPFEVESACAGPVGVIIQRRQKPENTAPIDFKFPRVPPNSFVSSQLTAFNSSQQTTFSVEGLGNPKSLPLRMSSTLDDMWEPPLERTESRWPRLMSLTDPLLELGLVITDLNPQATKGLRRNASKKSSFLDPAEEILHVEEIRIPGTSPENLREPLVIGITINRESSTYTVWRLTYLHHEDPFVARPQNTKNKTARRRSSMQPGFASGASTPVQPNFRESFGAPLPGKRQRKSERFEKPMDLVSSLEQQDKEGSGVTRRSSRRVSSMLARADLSASHDRTVYAEQPPHTSHAASKRHESQASQHRVSANFSHQIHPSLSSLLEAPLDLGLDEGFHNMGLDDHDFDGLQHEIVFTKIHTVPLDNSNFRYSTTDRPARNETHCFILTAPPFAVDEFNHTELLIGIQDRTEKRLQLITLHVQLSRQTDRVGKSGRKDLSKDASISITLGDLRRAQSVVDSCKLVDEEQSVILVLSESMDGKHELSTQAPWSERTIVSLSLLFVENTKSLTYRGRAIDRDVRHRKSEVIDITNGSIVGIRHPRLKGVVDVVDVEGRLHELAIHIQPSVPQVRKVLDTCRGILGKSLGERIAAGWLQCRQWLESRDDSVSNPEWSALVTLILALFLNIGRTDTRTIPTASLPYRKRRPASGSFGSIRESDDWKALEAGETLNSQGCPEWMMNRGWEWALDEGLESDNATQADQIFRPKFMSRHIAFAKEFIASDLGQSAFGAKGFMPTSQAKGLDAQRENATDIFMGLHLLLEEQKLDIMTPELASPGRADLRVVLCQVARWLKWYDFASIYELGIQEELDQCHDSGKLRNRYPRPHSLICIDLSLKSQLPPPSARPEIFGWIQSCFVGDQTEDYLTPADVYYAANSHLPEADKLWDRRWDGIFPRTLMFKRFFRLLKSNPNAVQMVEAMRDAGITPLVLQTLPEAILVPLQDAISLCQPHPPSSWPKDLLDFVNRSDISMILAPKKRPKPTSSNILVSVSSKCLRLRTN